MRTADFSYDLPDELIARFPTERRRDSRLLVLRAGESAGHRQFADFPSLIGPDDLLVFNDTRVIPARLFGHKASGGKVEILVERITSPSRALAHVRASKSPKPGSRIVADGGAELAVLERNGELFELERIEGEWLPLLNECGHMPLPPYIDRADQVSDRERYQTVYAREPGAVAAPTAGLHFDEEMLAALRASGIRTAEVTLHVGAGTFQPVRVDDVSKHRMHSEWMSINQGVVDAVNDTRARGGRVIAIGTTVVRTLESAARSGAVQAMQGETDIFIYPGFRFNVVDAMLTNFHLPESTLLMLVSAFAGYRRIQAAYREAIRERYRFFSYGDAMFLECDASAGAEVPR